jgi:acyl-CoA thioesterase-1
MTATSVFVRSSAACLGTLLVGTVTFVCLAGCGRDDASRPRDVVPPIAAAPSSRPPALAATAVGPRVVFLGDSLTAGLGVDGDQAFPAVVAQTLASEGLPVRMVNAGVSGDTTAGGVSRLDWLLRQSPDVVVLGLGANDGLRGLDLAQMEANLRQIITRSRAAGADVLLLGMRMPPSHGPEYAERFRAVFPRLARELSVPLVPFLLEGVGGDPTLNQADGIHPTADGQRLLAGNVVPLLRPLVRARAAKAGGTPTL